MLVRLLELRHRQPVIFIREWGERVVGLVLTFVVAAIGILLVAMVLPGCSGMPQDGIVGFAYCGQEEPMTAGYCPCTHELRITAAGFSCSETWTQIPPG